MKNIKSILLGCACAPLLWVNVALAQEQEGAQEKTDAEESKTENQAETHLDVITVYATRNPIPAFDYPGQVTVIGRDLIDDFNPSTISDVFVAIPGASFDSGPRRSGDTPDIRGLSGEGVLVLFDGARQSFLSGHDGRFFIDPDLVQAVEVVRGPASALYGSGALGGVIALRTITASDVLEEGETSGIKVSAGFQGVNNEWRVGATGVWRSAGNKVDLVGNFTLRNSGDIELGNDIALPADDKILSSLLKVTTRPTDAVTLSASWIRYGADSIDPNNPQGVNVAGPGNEQVLRNTDSNTVRGLLNYAPSRSDLIDLNLVGYYTRNEVLEDVVDSPRIVTRRVETLGLSFDNRSKFSFGERADLTLTYGGEYYRDEQIGRDNATVDGTRGGVPDATGQFYGAFVQAELALQRPLGAPGVLTLIPGVRWDRFENEAPGEPTAGDEAFSPKIGVSYKPVKELIIFGNWSEAFRAPSFNELFADNLHFQIPNRSVFPPTLVSNFFIPNLDLIAEESQSWEIGAGVDLDNIVFKGDSFTTKASYYRSNVDNLINLEVRIPAGCFGAPFPPCGSGATFGNFSRNVNVANADLDGFEIEAYYNSDYVYVRANFSTIDGRDADNGAFIGALSPDTVFIDSGIKWSAADIRLGVRVTAANGFTKVNDSALERDGFTKADIYAVWEPENGPVEGLRFDVGIDNVTDTDFEIVAAGVSQPGRNIKVAMSWKKGF